MERPESSASRRLTPSLTESLARRPPFPPPPSGFMADFLLDERLAFVTTLARVTTGLRRIKTPSHLLFMP
jgi:hypothetical protein